MGKAERQAMKRAFVFGAIGLCALVAAYLLFMAFGSRPAGKSDEMATPAKSPVNADETGGTAHAPSEEEPRYFARTPDTRG
jgi:hypothetical protein